MERGANTNFTPGVGVSGKQWFCDMLQIYEAQIPADAQLYKTFSVYYVGGVGFWVLNGDARRPPIDDDWHPLQFAYYNEDYSSYLTHAGQWQTLRLQPQDERWADMLLPSTNHTHTRATGTRYGGLTGELPVFLALLAFSTCREYLPNVLPTTLSNGAWISTHAWQMPSKWGPLYRAHRPLIFAGIHQRGVVVTVYTCPPTYRPTADPNWKGSTSTDLYNYEMGYRGKYYP